LVEQKLERSGLDVGWEDSGNVEPLRRDAVELCISPKWRNVSTFRAEEIANRQRRMKLRHIITIVTAARTHNPRILTFLYIPVCKIHDLKA
jgi:hypothetical protein